MKKLATSIALAAISIGAANAAIVSLNPFTVTNTSGTTTVHTDVQTLPETIVNATYPVAYLVTNAYLDSNNGYSGYSYRAMFTQGGADQLGVDLKKSGTVQSYQLTPTVLTYDAGNVKDATTQLIYKVTWLNSTQTTLDVWVNPTASSVEGSPSFGGGYANTGGGRNVDYDGFNQKIVTQNLDETITVSGTTVIYGSDATFTNALTTAGLVPEPSAALLGSLGMLLVLRRRRN